MAKSISKPLIDPRRCVEHPDAGARKQRRSPADLAYCEVRYACNACGLWWTVPVAADDAWRELDRLRKAKR